MYHGEHARCARDPLPTLLEGVLAIPKTPAPADRPHPPELELAEVKTLVKIGKVAGRLTDDEVDGAIGDIDLTHQQIENIYAHFAESGIER